jgi:hypothetical protein
MFLGLAPIVLLLLALLTLAAIAAIAFGVASSRRPGRRERGLPEPSQRPLPGATRHELPAPSEGPSL